jgi:hypothetical protein
MMPDPQQRLEALKTIAVHAGYEIFDVEDDGVDWVLRVIEPGCSTPRPWNPMRYDGDAWDLQVRTMSQTDVHRSFRIGETRVVARCGGGVLTPSHAHAVRDDGDPRMRSAALRLVLCKAVLTEARRVNAAKRKEKS